MFRFLRDGAEQPLDLEWPAGGEKVRQAISEAMSARNVAFLLGAGCSSFRKNNVEVGIATMAPLAREFCGETLRARAEGFYTPPELTKTAGEDVFAEDPEPMPGPEPDADSDHVAEPEPETPPAPWRLTKEEVDYLDAIGVDLEEYNGNLERLAEVLFSQRFVLRQSTNSAHWGYRDAVDGIIKKLKTYLLERISTGPFAENDTTVRDLYERFYKKLVLRDRSLPSRGCSRPTTTSSTRRPWTGSAFPTPTGLAGS